MNWLARLKSKKGPDTHATKATKPLLMDAGSGFVGFVAYPLPPLQKIEAIDSLVANDAPVESNHKVTTRVAATSAEPDRWSWPNGTAMGQAELDIFTGRLARFTDLGLSIEAAEALADNLVIRDREGDDRGICLECRHLVGSVRCSTPELSGLGVTGLRVVEVHPIRDRLQRCPGLLRQ